MWGIERKNIVFSEVKLYAPRVDIKKCKKYYTYDDMIQESMYRYIMLRKYSIKRIQLEIKDYHNLQVEITKNKSNTYVKNILNHYIQVSLLLIGKIITWQLSICRKTRT